VKRFYRKAAFASAADGLDGFALLLDGRPVRTPARAALVVPTARLAEAIAAEWNAQRDRVDPRSMPLTGLANAAIDRAAPDPTTFAAGLAAYGETDLLCYRAEAPQALVHRQSMLWDPLLAWARRRFDAGLETVAGIVHRPQPAAALDRLGSAVAAMDAFSLAALSPLVTISGSLVIALALSEGAVSTGEAWAATTLDEAWQAENWGEDELAAAVLEARRREFEAAGFFLSLL
jgi:chaperone required for assembly of F1-ATPase